MRDVQKKLGPSRVCRVESGGTQVGIPDMYITIGHGLYGQDTWIECKLDKKASIKYDKLHVKWGPGQQRFAMRYRAANTAIYDDYITTRNTWTFVKCKDGVVIIPMYKGWDFDMVSLTDDNVTVIPESAWNELTQEALIKYLWYSGRLALAKFVEGKTINEYVNTLVTAYMPILQRKRGVLHSASKYIANNIKKYMPYDWQYVPDIHEYHGVQVYLSCRCRRMLEDLIERRRN